MFIYIFCSNRIFFPAPLRSNVYFLIHGCIRELWTLKNHRNPRSTFFSAELLRLFVNSICPNPLVFRPILWVLAGRGSFFPKLATFLLGHYHSALCHMSSGKNFTVTNWDGEYYYLLFSMSFLHQWYLIYFFDIIQRKFEFHNY